ncbi:hypothetical protein [Reyranella sp.]|uniref:hypothetical protein n=1 Tax=Reyranella sp. TaxID=1929291 RepID=UPI003D0E632C
MSKPETDATVAASDWRSALAYPELQEVTYLRRALEIAEQDGFGLNRADMQRVEAMWSIESGDWIALGFVLALQDGRRAYLDYHYDFAEDEEEVDVQPMGGERRPAIKSGGIEWSDEVGELNRLLMS